MDEHPNRPEPLLRRLSRMKWLRPLLLVLLAASVYLYWPKAKSAASNDPSKGGAQKSKDGSQKSKGGGQKKKGGRGGEPPVTPVMGTRAQKGNIGVYFNGLGAVTPIYTVTIKSRVDGQLMTIHFQEGDTVQKGDLLMEIDPRPYQVQLTQAEGELMKDQAALENARTDLIRYQTLLQQNAIPEQQVATQKAAVAQGEGTIKSDQGLVDSAKLNLTYTRITAPITGRLGLRLVDPGNIVHAGDTNGLVVITQMDPISVLFTISEDQLPVVLQKMRAGQKLTVDAYDREMKRRISAGKLITVDNEIDQTTGTVRLRATFDNKGRGLFPSQFVNARLLVEEKRGVVLLRTAAIQRTTNKTFVYLVKPDSTTTIRDIAVGVTEGDNSEIASGLAPGDVVVMTGADKLQEGSQVRVEIPEEQTGTSPAAGNKPQAGRSGGEKRK